MPETGPGRLLLIGTSHHVAPVALRERLVEKGGERAVERLSEALRARIGPAVLVSTCNRLEVYCWTARRRAPAVAALLRLLGAWSGLPPAGLEPHLYVRTGVDAAHHLIRVAAGLDSLALGESEILGQVRAAWQAARGDAEPRGRQSPVGRPPSAVVGRGGALGPELDGLFRGAIEAARQIRAQGAFDRHPSVAGLAVEAAATALGGVAGRRAAVLGAGATAKAAARALLAAGAGHVVLLNRSAKRAAAAAEALAASGRVSAAALDALPPELAAADALICATAAPSQIVTARQVAAALSARHGRPLVVVDIAVPRDVEGAVRGLPGVHLIDLDDLEAQCPLDAGARRHEMARAEALARSAAEAYAARLRLRAAVPDIVALRAHAEGVRAAALRRAAGRLRDLSPEQTAAVEQVTRAIVQKLLHRPTLALRATAALDGPAGRRARASLMAALVAPPESQEATSRGPRSPLPLRERGRG